MIPLKSPKTLAMREEVELDTLSKWVKLNTPSNSQTENRRRTDNTMTKRKRTKGQTTIYKTNTLK